jgi:predicted DNA-binding transcriptional regulator
MQGVTEEQILTWLAEIERERIDQEGVTVRELAAHLGISDEAARARVRSLLAAGRMEPTRVTRPRMDGIVQTTSGYRVVEA